MTREEAARVLTREAEVLTKEADGWVDERVLFETYKTALRMGAAALRGPQVDNDSTNRRKTVKQIGRNLYSETARCDYCGRYTKDSDLTAEFTKDKYLMCRDCKEKHT